MDYFLLSVTVLFSVIASALTRVFSRDNKGLSDYMFNALGCVMWIFVLLPGILTSSDISFGKYSIIYGVIYGVLLFLYLFSNCRAVEVGSYTLTRVMACPAFIVATLFGVFYCGEGISTNQIIGMILICVSLLLCVNPKFGGEKLTGKWFAYSFLHFAANGLIGVVYKLFGTVCEENGYDAMLITAAITAVLLYSVFVAFDAVKNGKRIVMPKGKIALLTVLTGVFTCLSIRINIYLSNVIPSAVFFPVSNCAIIVLSTLTGMSLFREKLSKIQISGIFLGLISILISSI